MLITSVTKQNRKNKQKHFSRNVSVCYDTGPLQYRSRPGRDTTCQGKGKFDKLGGEKSCIVVYGSARSSGCEAHGPSATATI